MAGRGDDVYKAGLDARRRIAGEGRFDPADDSSFRREFRELTTRYAWGEVWSRPGLEPRVRSLITMAMIIALRLDAELKSHVRTALRLGITPEELNEMLLQAAVYVGLPMANRAYEIVEEVLMEGGGADAIPPSE
jgi:alkylhydroperoxidase/carboxymuconolactone decarboxylase family protein YurZ